MRDQRYGHIWIGLPDVVYKIRSLLLAGKYEVGNDDLDAFFMLTKRLASRNNVPFRNDLMAHVFQPA